MGEKYILYGAIRSSAAYRVRIVMHLKGIAFREHYLDLHAGEQSMQAYRSLNPQMLVPALATPDGGLITQSMAIMEYLDEAEQETSILPETAAGRARVRSLSQMIACDIHPVNNLRVRNHVRDLLVHDAGAQAAWIDKWLAAGLDALEERLAREKETGRFCHGDTPGMADACLVPQLNNARSSSRDLSSWPTLLRIAEACDQHPAFAAARPDALRRSENRR